MGIVPITTLLDRLTGARWVGSIAISAATPDAVPGVIDATGRLLRLRHHLAARQPDDFTVRNISDVQQVRLATSQTQALLLAGIAVVSLVVGGIGIMNIMLVSVTERTREIGLRMAVGARGRDILLQSLVEVFTLACIGDLIGIASGLATARVTAVLGHWPVLVFAVLDRARVRLRCGGRGDRRVLSREARGGARPDRRAAVRIGPVPTA